MGKNKDMKKEGWCEVKQGIFKFEKVGDTLEGKLLEKKESEEFNNTDYKIKSSDGIEHILFGTVMLNSLMETVPIDAKVRIEFMGTTPAKKEGHNDTKEFKVFWKKE